MSKIVFIADFFLDDILGGGELNNEELIKVLIDRGHSVKKIHSHLITEGFLKKNKNNSFIIANFVNLSKSCINFLTSKCSYVIYEHDHKYLPSRDPGVYENFLAPKDTIINYEFYKCATAVLCQSSFHMGIVKKNLELDNIVSLGGNLWSLDSLNYMLEVSKKTKEDRCSILSSTIEHKNTKDAISYCSHKNLNYQLVESSNYRDFLSQLGSNKTFVFFPKTPETLSRVVVESRMMGMTTITNNRIGATQEVWFNLKGPPLVEYMKNKREEITNTVENILQKEVS